MFCPSGAQFRDLDSGALHFERECKAERAGLYCGARIAPMQPVLSVAKPMDVIGPDRCDTTSVAEWLIDGARSAPEAGQVLAELCHRLLACGIPLWRVAVFVRTLHPDIPGRAFVWRSGEEVQVRAADFELFES